MAGKIFISYRRGDDPRSVSALYARLEQEFGRDNVLMDEEAYAEPGEGYARDLAALVARCDILLAVIGPQWLEKLAARAGDPEDFVRIEIEAALYQRKPAIPVMVGGATLPSAEDLPETIQGLVRRGSVSLRPSEFETGCDALINALKQAFAAAGRAGTARQAANTPQAQQRAQQHTQAAGTPGDAREAEELANWNFIKASTNPEHFRAHLARFAGGPTERYAWGKIESLQGEQVRQQGARHDERHEVERRHNETGAWSKVAASKSIRELEDFLAEWPNGAYAGPAQRRLSELREGNPDEGGAFGLLIMLGIVVLVIGLVALAGMKF